MLNSTRPAKAGFFYGVFPMDLKPYLKMIGAVAPTLAAAIGGPLASTAVGAVVNALGIGPDAQDQIEATLAAGSPDTLAKLKIAEEDFKVTMKQLDIDLERINASDRDSARNREAAVRDKTPMILAYSVSIGFFGILYLMMTHGLPSTGNEALLVMLGSLGTGWTAMLSYYFGSSAGSNDKNAIISKLAGGK